MIASNSGELSQPVITIDGPSGSGKGSICQLLAQRLGWNLLDSGALYRIVGLAAQRKNIHFDDAKALAELAAHLPVEFVPSVLGEPATVILDGEDVSAELRSETTGELASVVAVHNDVRNALIDLQRSFVVAPGLVADGRDMGTVIFPDAPLKFYLTASAEERANRRYKQLINKGESVNLAALLEDIRLRDDRDTNREIAPLKPAEDAIVIDSTASSVDDVLNQVLKHVGSILGVAC